MSIENPTLDHFRHFYPLCPSTSVEIAIQIHSTLTNKPNFMRFTPENDDFTKNKPNSKQIQTQFDERLKLMQNVNIQRIMKKKPYCGFVKTKPIKANNQSSLITNHLEGKPKTNPNFFNTLFRLLYTLRGLFWGICVWLNALLIGDWTDLIRNWIESYYVLAIEWLANYW